MNQKQIESQIEKLNKKKEELIAKRDEATSRANAEIGEITAQVNGLHKVRDQLIKFEEEQRKQMELAESILKKKPQGKKTEPEPEPQVTDDSPLASGSTFHVE